MTNEEALELGLVLAELESQLKARETPASPEEAGEMLHEIMARHAAEREKLQRPSPEASRSKTFALVEDGTSRVWLFLASGGSVKRLLDGTWVDAWRTPEEVIMPDELGDFREASDDELFLLLLEAAASSTLSPTLAGAALQAEQPHPESAKARKPYFSKEAIKIEGIRSPLVSPRAECADTRQSATPKCLPEAGPLPIRPQSSAPTGRRGAEAPPFSGAQAIGEKGSPNCAVCFASLEMG